MDVRMSLYANRFLAEEKTAEGGLENCGIENRAFRGFKFNNALRKQVRLRDICADSAVFRSTCLEDCAFSRSSLTGTLFRSSVMQNVIFDCLALIRGFRLEGKLKSFSVKSSCMQRIEMKRMRISSCVFTGFEAVESLLENCVFADTCFIPSCGSGMNGFSGARIKNCIFYNCRFEGAPLRGAALDNCLFIRCSGETGHKNPVRLTSPTPLLRRDEARALLEQFSA
jgi:uncharacterized protein YjbI with pentapeptide repeats